MITEQKKYPPGCQPVTRFEKVFTFVILKEPGISGDCFEDQPGWNNVERFGCYVFQYSGVGGMQTIF